MIRLDNDGPRLVATSYWMTKHARRGLIYLSINAGALRLLVPAVIYAELVMSGVPAPGTECEVRLGPDRVQIIWLDDPAAPWAIDLDARQCDRRIPAEDDGRVVPLVWYGPGEGEGAVELRREVATIRRAP